MAICETFKSPVVVTKVVIILLGILVMGVGLISHFKSSWKIIRQGDLWLKPHRLCGAYGGVGRTGLFFPGTTFRIHWNDKESCPSISMEIYFVFIVIICFILSVLNLVASFLVECILKNYKTSFKFIDMIYHGISTILILAAGIVYIISAEQIKKLEFTTDGCESNFMIAEKLGAGALAVVLGLLYGVATFFTFLASGRQTT